MQCGCTKTAASWKQGRGGTHGSSVRSGISARRVDDGQRVRCQISIPTGSRNSALLTIPGSSSRRSSGACRLDHNVNDARLRQRLLHAVGAVQRRAHDLALLVRRVHKEGAQDTVFQAQPSHDLLDQVAHICCGGEQLDPRCDPPSPRRCAPWRAQPPSSLLPTPSAEQLP